MPHSDHPSKKIENVAQDMTLRQSLSEENKLTEQGYKLLKVLGQGGYAKVYLGEFKHELYVKPIQLACKVMDTHRLPKRFLNKFFPRELTFLAKLNHPHIIQIHSIFQRRSKYYIFMRHAENGDLYEYIKSTGYIPEIKARVWTRQLALALQYLHTLEIAHRDLKCENVLITINYNVKLSDFGFARHIINSDFQIELSKTFCGSISYVAPEILKGAPYNPKIADIWSFGVLLYTMVNGVYPFDAKHAKILLEHQLQGRWKFRSKIEINISDEVKSLTRHLLEPDIEKRYKVEEILSSSWIAMDSKLKELTNAEFLALKSAMEYANSAGLTTEASDGTRRRFFSSIQKINHTRNSLTFYRRYDQGKFDTHAMRSFLNKAEEKGSI